MRKQIIFLALMFCSPALVIAQTSNNKNLGNKAYNQALTSILALTPEEIQKLKKAIDIRQRAANRRTGGLLKGISESKRLILAPGKAGETVNVSVGRVTVITFLDGTGAPWPISKVQVGNGAAFQVEIPIENGPNLSITPLKEYGDGNLVVFLKDQIEPVSITIITNNKTYNERLVFSVAGRGPLALLQDKTNVGSPSQNDFLYDWLDGTIPEKARALTLTGIEDDTKAWVYKEDLILRSKGSLVSPAAHRQIKGSQGYSIFILPLMSQILISKNSKIKSVKVELNE